MGCGTWQAVGLGLGLGHPRGDLCVGRHVFRGREGDGPGQGHSWGRTRLLLCLHKLKAVAEFLEVGQRPFTSAPAGPHPLGRSGQGLKDLS